MTDPLERTLAFLAKTSNEAATSILLPALGSKSRRIRDEAFVALLERRSTPAQRELLKRWAKFSHRWKTLAAERPGRLATAVRDGILGSNSRICQNACDAAVWLGEFELMPPLISTAEKAGHPCGQLAAQTLLTLAEMLYEKVHEPRERRARSDPQLVRRHVVASLAKSVDRFDLHQRREIVEAFLLLTRRGHATLNRVLAQANHPAHDAVIDALVNSPRQGIMQLLLSFLEGINAPPRIYHVLSRRHDVPFLRLWLKKVGTDPSEDMRRNLRRIESLEWLDSGLDVLKILINSEQRAIVALIAATGVDRQQLLEIVKFLLEEGDAGGRQGAAAALAEFRSEEANELAIAALSDPDPLVQAQAVAQLREREIPGAMAMLIQLVDSPHAEVRASARQSLSEFTFERYLAAFDTLSDDARQSTGALIKKIDLDTAAKLRAELAVESRMRQLRALQVAAAMQIVDQLESTVIGLLHHDDHFLRAEAAQALGYCNTRAARLALREALLDRAVVVQEAADAALLRLTRIGPVAEPALSAAPRTKQATQQEHDW